MRRFPALHINFPVDDFENPPQYHFSNTRKLKAGAKLLTCQFSEIQWTLSIANSQGTNKFVRDRESSL